MVEVYVSLNGVKDPKNIESALEAALDAGVDGIHFDAIHNRLGSQPTNMHIFSPDYASKLVKYVAFKTGGKSGVEAHIFADDPSSYIEPYAQAGISRLTLPYQAFGSNSDTFGKELPHLRMDLRSKKLSPKIGISLSLSEFKAFEIEKFNIADYLVVLGATPGYDGRLVFPGIDDAVRNACEQRERVKKKYDWFNFEVGVEGGMNPSNTATMKRAGADRIIFGRSFFEAGTGTAAIFIESVRSV